jgi:hypothetical protein
MSKLVHIKRFGGEEHSGSSPDKKTTSADVMKDRIINPRGRLQKRPGYGALVSGSTAKALGHLSPLTDRFIVDNIVNTGGGTDYVECYNSHGRKCSVVGVSGSNTYEFQGVITVNDSDGSIILRIYRGLRANGEVTWSGSISDTLGTVSGATLDFGIAVNSASQDWVDYSMVLSGTSIYVAITLRNDTGAGTTYDSTVYVAKIDNIFTGTFNNANVGAWSKVDSADLVSKDDANEFVPFGIDIAVDGEGKLHVVIPYYDNTGSKYIIKYSQSNIAKDTWGSEVELTSAGDIHAPSIVVTPGGDGTENIYISWAEDAGTDLVKFRTFTADSSPSAGLGSPISLATSPILDGNYSWCRAILAIDTGGDLHFLYRTAAQNLYHSRYSGGTEDAKIVVSDAENFRKLSNTAYDVNTNNLPASQYHCWDMVVKNNFARVYLVDDEDTTVMSEVTRGNGNNWNPVREVESLATYHGFLNCRRVYEAYKPMSLMYIHTLGAVRDFKYVRDGISRDDPAVPLIEAMHEWEMPRPKIWVGGALVDVAPIQTIILQCSDNLYRIYNADNIDVPVVNYSEFRGLEWWERLDKTIENGGFGDDMTRPDPTERARFTDIKGIVRSGIGRSVQLAGIWYDAISRYFFTNDEENVFINHEVDVQPLQPPLENNVKDDDGFTFINNDNTLGDIFGATPNTTKTLNYRPFALYQGAQQGRIIDEAIEENVTLFEEFNYHFYVKMFWGAVSFIYDNKEESQLYVVGGDKTSPLFNEDGVLDGLNDARLFPSNVMWGGIVLAEGEDNDRVEIHPHLAFQLQMRHWNSGNADRTNPRITGIRIWLGEYTTRSQKIEDTLFYPVKEVVISKDSEFKDELYNGESVWTWNDPQYEIIMPIDLADWLAGVESGEYREINDHGMMQFKYDEEDGGLLESPFPEAYVVSEVVGDQHIIGNVRIDGKDHPDWIMFPAIRSEAGFFNKMNDVYPHALPMGFTVQGIVSLDERTIGVFGAGGEIAKVDVLERAILDRVGGRRGLPYPESVTRIDNTTLSLMDDKIWNWDGVHEPASISDPIENDSDQEGSTYQGLANTTKTEVWTFDLPAHHWTLFIFPDQGNSGTFMFVFDQERKAWYRWHFADEFVCGCAGLDGELFFSDGTDIFQFPSGTDDNGVEIEPVWMPSSTQLPEGFVAVINRLRIKYKLTGTTGAEMRVATIRDRGDLVAVNNDFDIRSLIPRVNQRYPYGTKVTDEIGLKVTIETQDAIISEIEEVIVEGTLLEDVR